MTAEDIIQRLLDEKHISVKEAMILLKAILGVVSNDWINKFKRLMDLPIDPVIDPDTRRPGLDVVATYGVNLLPQTVMYGVQNVPYYNKASDIVTINEDSATSALTGYSYSSATYDCSSKKNKRG